MPSFPLLDVAIGLVFIYLLLSLICSSVNEGLESFLRNRAIDLEAGIRRLLGDKPGTWWASFSPGVNSIAAPTITREFYRHPLIRNLFGTEKRLPTYIPARNFALAVMDIVAKDGGLVRGATNNPANSTTGVVEWQTIFNEAEIPASLRRSIQTLVEAAKDDAQQARINIENWFNSSMDRVSGWYKSRTQKMLFCIGVAATVTLNADSIAIVKNLAHSKNLQAVVAAAQAASTQKPDSGQDWQATITSAFNELEGLDIAIGWDHEPPRSQGQSSILWILHLLYVHVIGWLITAAAIALGAPFWFDTLNRFIVVRSTVKPKEKSPDEGSKDVTVG